MDGHEEKIMAKRLGYTLPILAAFLFIGISITANAAKPIRAESPVIVKVQTFYDPDVLIIDGANLAGTENLPIVVLNGVDLDVGTYDVGQVTATATAGFPDPGDYELLFDSAIKGTEPVRMMLTLGAVGPEGPPGESDLQSQTCSTGQFLVGFDSAGDIVCEGSRIPGDSCTTTTYCESGLTCTDATCCTSVCDGTCETCGLDGTCAPVPQGEDPDSECSGADCSGNYYGWVNDTCYSSANVTDGEASCNGAGECLSTAELCANSGTGAAELTCDGVCQTPTPGTCTGTTGGNCNNIDAGIESCGRGECLAFMPRCSGGEQQVCVPGTPDPEICNGVDDDCDGDVDDGFDLFSDVNNCGACGSACPGIGAPNTTVECHAALCQLICDDGYKDCDGFPNNGCEGRLVFGICP
jgi:hypothetical protein